MRKLVAMTGRGVWIALVFLCMGLCVEAQIKLLYGPYLQNVKETEATFVWEATAPSVGWVEIAPNDGSHYYGEVRPRYFDTANGVKRTDTRHVVRVSGLRPGTTYRYRVYAQEVLQHEGHYVAYGRIAATDVYGREPLRFTTSDWSKPTTSFLMLNDIHGRQQHLAELLAAGQHAKQDLVIFNGDMVSTMKDKQGVFEGFMNESVRLFASEQPMYYARGNHETRGAFATAFQDYFSPKEPHLYYAFRQGPVCFIMLDSGEDKPDSDLEYYGITDYDSYRSEQAAWLETLANDPAFTTARFRIAICHMPPSIRPDVWHGQREVMEKFVPALNRLGIDLMLCGHEHRYEFEAPNEKIAFPVLTNSNETAVVATYDGQALEVQVVDTKGNVVERKRFVGQ